MIIVLTSPKTVKACADGSVIQALKDVQKQGHPVGIISNHDQSAWTESEFGDSGVTFLSVPGRQKGVFVKDLANHFNMEPFNVVVLAGNREDMHMGKNGGGVVIGVQWATDDYVKSIGIEARDASDIRTIVHLVANWPGSWWYQGSGSSYNVRALADLSTYGKTQAQATFANRLRSTVKSGGPALNSLLAITARTLLIDGINKESDLVWGVYPGSSSNNNDTDVLSDFTHRLRTTVSKVRSAKRGEPLFIRHTPSIKRHTTGSIDRHDPTNQVETIHLNPIYEGKLKGKRIIIVDDCTTYGVSFAVASAFLNKAGAEKVTGVALGKFGNQLMHREIEIHSDPFKPVTQFTVGVSKPFSEVISSAEQYNLSKLV